MLSSRRFHPPHLFAVQVIPHIRDIGIYMLKYNLYYNVFVHLLSLTIAILKDRIVTFIVLYRLLKMVLIILSIAIYWK